MPLTPGDYIGLDVPPQFCPICQVHSGRIGAANEVVITDENEFLGVEGVIRFEDCGHRVPNSTAHPWLIADMLEHLNSEGDFDSRDYFE